MKEKPFEGVARIDNRGTIARGPWQYLGQVTANNLAASHEAFTVTYAGTFQLEELQFLSANYRQVLTSEGLTAFASASYGVGRPGTALLNLLDYRTRSSAFEAGLSYPVIRSREKNLTLTGLGFLTNDESFTSAIRSRATGCAACAARRTATGPTAGSASTRSM